MRPPPYPQQPRRIDYSNASVGQEGQLLPETAVSMYLHMRVLISTRLARLQEHNQGQCGYGMALEPGEHEPLAAEREHRCYGQAPLPFLESTWSLTIKCDGRRHPDFPTVKTESMDELNSI